jgi:hypothetical protein
MLRFITVATKASSKWKATALADNIEIYSWRKEEWNDRWLCYIYSYVAIIMLRGLTPDFTDEVADNQNISFNIKVRRV